MTASSIDPALMLVFMTHEIPHEHHVDGRPFLQVGMVVPVNRVPCRVIGNSPDGDRALLRPLIATEGDRDGL